MNSLSNFIYIFFNENETNFLLIKIINLTYEIKVLKF